MTADRDVAIAAAAYVRKSPGKAAVAAAKRLSAVSVPERAMGDALLAALDAAFSCRCCGRHLKNQVSRALRVGPECRDKLEVGVARLLSARRCNQESEFIDVVLVTDDGVRVEGVVDSTRPPFVELFHDGVRAATLALTLKRVDLAYQVAIDGRRRRFTMLRRAVDADYPLVLEQPQEPNPPPVPVAAPDPVDLDPLTARWASFTSCVRLGVVAAAGVAA